MPSRVLLLIDIQKDYLSTLPIEYPPVQDSLARVAEAMDAAHRHSIPVVAVQNMAPAASPVFAAGSDGVELHDVVRRGGYDDLIVKHLPDAFAGTGLAESLRESHIDTLTVAGYMTHNCVLATILSAVHHGFVVEFLSDASGSLSYENRAGHASAEELHRACCVVLQSRFAAVMTVSEWSSMLDGAGTAERDTIYNSNRRARGL
jgi:nicotinamidase-related amidase